MSKIEVDQVDPQSGTTLTLGTSGDTVNIPSGVTITNNGSQTGFGRTGAVDWQTTIKTSTFTAVSGEGYFVDTNGGAVTVNLPAGTAGAIVAIKDYRDTFDTNAVTLDANGSDKIGGSTDNATLAVEGISVTLVFTDSTRGWLVTGDGSESSAPQGYSADVLVVAGGGGGGSYRGGGGGAGGYRTSTQLLFAGNSYTVTVGDGGSAGTSDGNGGTGSNSQISGTGLTTITSAGGGYGRGANGSGSNGGDGGSGGGAVANTGSGGSGNTPSTTPSQGNDGGQGQPSGGGKYGSGGGGGAGAVGTQGSTSSGGAGGNGTASSITGSSVTRAGGGAGGSIFSAPSVPGGSGGGGSSPSNSDGNAGTANTGGGGGGANSNDDTTKRNGGAGGKGVVILSVPDADYSGTTTGSPTVTTGVSGKTVMVFNSSGSYTG